MIDEQMEAEIRRLHRQEGWRVGTIARQLGIHHKVVSRVLEDAGLRSRLKRRSKLDPYVSFIGETLRCYPTLPTSTIHEMLERRGYQGGADHVRHKIAEWGLRPKRPAEAFLELRTLPGEQAQVDWADFGRRQVEGGVRRLFAFVMVLAFSRLIFLRFFLDARLPSFLAGHVGAFESFDGVARSLLYDNLKSAVVQRRGRAIQFHLRLLELADHYGFDPRPVAPRRATEKGRIERAIRYVRTSFFPLRAELSVEALNREAVIWCRGRAAKRPWPQDRRRTVEQAWHQERRHLLPLPGEPFVCHEVVPVAARKTPYVRFDANRYSVPHDRLRRTLMIHAEPERVRIFDRHELIAEHRRSWDKGQVVEDAEHLEALCRAKRRARRARDQDRLLRAVPRTEELLVALAQRQRRLGNAVDQLLRLLDEHGREETSRAVDEALEKGSPHPHTVRLVLDRRRRSRHLPPPVPVELRDDPKLRDLVVTPHHLADYDPAKGDDEEDAPSSGEDSGDSR